MDHDVIVLKRREDAELLNVGLDDDNKVAFEDKEGERFYTYTTTDVSGLDSTNYFASSITASIASGTLPVLKKRRMFV